MLTTEFSHVTCGDVGEGVIRQGLVQHLERRNRIHMLDDRAHMTWQQAIELGGGPMFTSIRSPYDWYISMWFHRIRNRRYFGPFKRWFYETKPVFVDTWHYFAGHDIPKERIVRFEYIEEDFPRVLHDVWPEITTEEVRSWFPAVFAQWSGRLWSELAEQWLRDDLYTTEMVKQIEEQDAEFFGMWDYTFEQRFISDIPPT